ncbi:MAG TPA: MIP/aquaporin family protein [Urbifossiella sp.]|nr:MIP/aquaporin family protein [Urbifossiella sp.]
MDAALGEFLGTAVLIVLGDGVVAGVLLNQSKAKDAGWIAVTAGWAFAVMAGVFTARAAGAPGFINPVGPFAAALTGAMATDRALLLAGAELAGAFVGAVVVWLHYLPHWALTTDPAAKLAVFATGPAVRAPGANLLSEAVATFVLVLVGSAILEKEIGRGFVAPLGAALVWGIGLSLGGTTGYAINPARDLGPRLAHALLPIPGKGSSDWGYAWVPVIGPLLGGGLAALVAKEVFVTP